MGVFRLIVAGGRNFSNYKLLELKLDKMLKNVTDKIVIVSGKASGADSLGEMYAKKRGYTIKEYPAEWDNLDGVDDRYIRTNRYGKPYNVRAGLDRNLKMAENAEALAAFWDGFSSGTANMIETAKNKNLKVRVIKY